MRTRTRLAVLSTAIIMAMLLGAAPAMAKAKDRNKSGIPDSWETKYHMSLKRNQARSDFDHDGLKNIDEYRSGTNPRKADTDKDGVRDGQEDPDGDELVNVAEVEARTNPRVADSDKDGVIDSDEDPDDDRLLNGQEYQCLTDPLDDDSDSDGVTDAYEDADEDGLDNADEFAQGCDPRDEDSDDDGTGDSDEVAGYVSAYDPESRVLTIGALNDSERTYDIRLDDETLLLWADVAESDSDPTLADLKPGAVVNEVEGEMQDDGTTLATRVMLMPAPHGRPFVATIAWFDPEASRLGLTAAVDDNCSYEVLVDESTQYAWAAGVGAEHDPGLDDLAENSAVTDLDVTYTADGELLAKKIVLIPPTSTEADADDDAATDVD